MSNEFNGTDEFLEPSVEQNQDQVSTVAPTQPDRLGQHTLTIPAQSDRLSTSGTTSATFTQTGGPSSFPTQPDRLEQRPIVRSDAAPHDNQSTSPTHEDFDLIVENVR